MKHNIHDCPDHAADIERNGGIDRIKELRAKELMLHKEENHEHYNIMELMICVAARELGNGHTAGIGTGAPCAAACWLKNTRATSGDYVLFKAASIPFFPNCRFPSVIPAPSTGPSNMAGSMFEIMQTCSRGMVDYAILGRA